MISFVILFDTEFLDQTDPYSLFEIFFPQSKQVDISTIQPTNYPKYLHVHCPLFSFLTPFMVLSLILSYILAISSFKPNKTPEKTQPIYIMDRPNRSDIHLSKEEEERKQEETREYFDELAPKRHSKPQRSEYSSNYVDANTTSDVIPELAVFQRLENDPQKLDYSNGSKAPEEFVETDYYKDLNCVGKQHYKTGTGFIKMEDNGNINGINYNIEPDLDIINHHASYKGNPATNDWIPSGDNEF